MNGRGRHTKEPSAFDLIEETIYLLRRVPAGVLASYYIGSLPFVLAVIYFFAEMSRGPLHSAYCAQGALWVSVLFVWMKVWHAVFAQGLHSHLTNSYPARWSGLGLLRLVARQLAVQPSGLFLIPLSLLLMAPFGWVYAFYQNACVLDDREGGLGVLIRRAWAQAKVWPKQNHILIWLLSPALLITAVTFYVGFLPLARIFVPEWTQTLLYVYAALLGFALLLFSPFGVVVFINLQFAIFLCAFLLKALLGVETHFTKAPAILDSPTVFATICGLTCLCMDPLMKAAYGLRCFYSESLRSGQDLKLALRSLNRPRAPGLALLLVLAMAIVPAPLAYAEERLPDSVAKEGPAPLISPVELDRAITAVLQQEEYIWRLPPDQRLPDDLGLGPIGRFFQWVADWTGRILEKLGQWLVDFIEWLFDLFPSRETEPGGGLEWRTVLKILACVAVTGLALAVAGVLFRLWKRRRTERLQAVPVPLVSLPDISDENVGADKLPEDLWLAMARDLLARGETRLALRALFLAALARLGSLGLISLARFKSNLDYVRELNRRSHVEPELASAFTACIPLFERVWYGRHEATAELVDQFTHYYERIQTCGQEQ